MQHVHPQAVAPRDECTNLPKLCTDPVLLRGYETTLTYLCPETKGPSTITVTTTHTTTLTVDLTSSMPVMATSDGQAPVIEEPTTTVTAMSTAHVTITKLVTKVAATPKLSALPPPTITWSFTAVLPSDVNPFGFLRKSSTTPSDVVSSSVSFVSAPPSSVSNSFEVFPSHAVSNSSSILSTSSAATSSWAGRRMPLFSNHTHIHAGGNFPTINLVRGAEDKPTETVATTAAVATEGKKGQAGDTQASFIALFFGVLAATFLI